VERGADLTAEELTQWRKAVCHSIAKGASERTHIAWIVPLWTKNGTEAHALFLCGAASRGPDDEPELEGVYETFDEAKAALANLGPIGK
jgi:hypothetical protein